MYTTGGTRRAVTALDAATGEQFWVYSLNEGQRGVDAPRKLSGRGLAFWQKGRDRRVLYVTPGYQLIALDASTGRPVGGFGKSGIEDTIRRSSGCKKVACSGRFSADSFRKK